MKCKKLKGVYERDIDYYEVRWFLFISMYYIVLKSGKRIRTSKKVIDNLGVIK